MVQIGVQLLFLGVLDQAGILNTAIPKFQSCDAGVKWFKDKNQFDYVSRYGGGGLPAPRKSNFLLQRK